MAGSISTPLERTAENDFVFADFIQVRHVIWGPVERCNVTGLSAGSDPALRSDSVGKGYIEEVMKNVEVLSDSMERCADSSDGCTSFGDAAGQVSMQPGDRVNLFGEVTAEEERRVGCATGQVGQNPNTNVNMISRSLGEDSTRISTNAQLHVAGLCKPCQFLLRKGVCTKGDECIFCHETHLKPLAKPRRKVTRDHCKQRLSELDHLIVNDPIQFKAACLELLEPGGYMAMAVKAKLKTFMAHHNLDPDLLQFAQE